MLLVTFGCGNPLNDVDSITQTGPFLLYHLICGGQWKWESPRVTLPSTI